MARRKKPPRYTPTGLRGGTRLVATRGEKRSGGRGNTVRRAIGDSHWWPVRRAVSKTRKRTTPENMGSLVARPVYQTRNGPFTGMTMRVSRRAVAVSAATAARDRRLPSVRAADARRAESSRVYGEKRAFGRTVGRVAQAKGIRSRHGGGRWRTRGSTAGAWWNPNMHPRGWGGRFVRRPG